MPGENKNIMMAIIAVIIVIVIGIVIFFVAQGNKSVTTDNSTINPPVSTTPIQTGNVYELTAQNDSGQNGSVKLEANGDSTKVTINLTNPNSTSQPAHIHTGACPEPGGVKYPLTNMLNGTSLTNIKVKLSDLKAMGELAVNIHKSAAESDIYVACGDLDF